MCVMDINKYVDITVEDIGKHCMKIRHSTVCDMSKDIFEYTSIKTAFLSFFVHSFKKTIPAHASTLFGIHSDNAITIHFC